VSLCGVISLKLRLLDDFGVRKIMYFFLEFTMKRKKKDLHGRVV
jgi:hypothetical protein